MTITINGSGTITGATTLATTVASPTFTTPNIDSAQFATISGTAPLYACRAWVNFNGQGTVAIRASGNVSSITDNGVGDYTVNFTTSMPNVNYGVAFGMSDYWRCYGIPAGNTTYMNVAYLRFQVVLPSTAASNDPEVACVSIFR